VCKPRAKKGESCETKDCIWSARCWLNPETKEKSCRQLLNVTDGTWVGNAEFETRSELQGLCHSYNILTVDGKMYCMPGDQSVTCQKNGKCIYHSYQIVSDFSSSTLLESENFCSENESYSTYCNLRKGDKPFLDYLEILKEAFA
jgi:hypothetical protein